VYRIWGCERIGLTYEYVQLSQRLLDLGIRSGLNSLPFHKAGLEIYGLDGSREILEFARKRDSRGN
jgi:2-polyprenyl-3-methyl-5-hydroxy-6-metoxy-1,4-benzoquinol methylase